MAVSESGNIQAGITEEFAGKVNAEIMGMKLPPSFKPWIEEYNEVGGHRDAYLWQIYLMAKKAIDFVPAQDECRESLREANFLVTMYIVFIDDVVDREQNQELFSVLARTPFAENRSRPEDLKGKEKDCVAFCEKLWDHVISIIEEYPAYKEFLPIFKFDLEGMVQSINYDLAISNNMQLINIEEAFLNQVHSMKFMTLTSLDLMCAPSIDGNGVNLVRELSTCMQEMLRIGNWISTWEREIGEEDFTSGVFAFAISEGIVIAGELADMDAARLTAMIKEAGIEGKLLGRWDENYEKLSRLLEGTEVIQREIVLDGMKKLLGLELISKGRK